MIEVKTGSRDIRVNVDDETGVNSTSFSPIGENDKFEVVLKTIDDKDDMLVVTITGTGSGNGEDINVGYNEEGKLICENADNVVCVTSDGSVPELTGYSVSVNGISLNKDNKLIELKEGESVSLKTVLDPADSKAKISYSSSNASAVSVSDKGVVTGLKPGRVIITVSVKDKDSGKTFSDTCTVVVRSGRFLAVKQKADVKELGIFKETYKKYEVSDKKLLSVNKKGIIKAKKVGSVTLTGIDDSGEKKESVEIVIEAPKFSEKSKKVSLSEVGDGMVIEGVDLLGDSCSIQPDKWESSKESVAAVDEKTGRITVNPLKGSAKITAYFGYRKNAAKVVYKIKVKK